MGIRTGRASRARPALRRVGVVAGAGLVASVAGCGEDAFLGGLGINFDFRFEPSTLAVVRGDTGPRTIQVDVVLVDVQDDNENRCSFRGDNPGSSLVVSGAGASGTEPGVFSLRSLDCSSFAIDVRSPVDVAVGSHSWELRGEWSREGFTEESLTRTLTVEVTSEIAVDITAPADGATFTAGPVALNATASTAFGELTTVEVVVADAPPDTVWTTTGGGETSVSLSEPVNVPAGTPTIVVRATNSLGNTWEDAVSVTAVGSAVVTWDGEAGNGLWNTPENWDGDAVPDAGSLVVIGAPADVRLISLALVEIRALSLAGRLTLTDGALRIAESSTIEGDLVLDHSLQPTNPPDLRLGGTLSVEGSLTCVRGGLRFGGIEVGSGASVFSDLCDWESLDVVNEGDILVNERATHFADGTSLENRAGATLRFQGGAISCSEVPCAGVVDNAGTIDASGFTARIEAFVTNRGTLDHGATGLTLAGGGENIGTITSSRSSLTLAGEWTMESGSSLAAGTVHLSSLSRLVIAGSTDVLNFAVGSGAHLDIRTSLVAGRPRIEVQQGELSIGAGAIVEVGLLVFGGGAIDVGTGADLDIRQSLAWYEGTLRGPGRTLVAQGSIAEPEASLTLFGFGPTILDGHRLLVRARTDWQDGDIQAGNGASFEISDAGFSEGVVYAYTDNAFDGNALGGAAARFVNDATVRKVGGTGTTTIEACYEESPTGQIVEDSGTVTVVQLCPPGPSPGVGGARP